MGVSRTRIVLQNALKAVAWGVDGVKVPDRTISPARMQWLARELQRWREQGLIDERAAQRIAESYTPSTRPQAVRLFVYLGAVLFGVGLIWLVAANVDIEEIGPGIRIATVAAAWLGFVVAGEALSSRTQHAPAGAARLLAALAYGATIFQSAQSLQVPAYEPSLLLAWGLGTLVYAYAARALAPLCVAVVTLVGWYVWALVDGGGDVAAVVLAFAMAAPVTAGLAALHDGSSLARLAGPWRVGAALFALLALFTAAIPDAVDGDVGPTLPLVLGALAGLGACVAGATRSARSRPELAGAVAVAVSAVVLIAFAPANPVNLFEEAPDGAQTAYTLIAAALFIAAAVGIALSGVARESRRLTDLAFAFLLVFICVQSFGLLASILSGAGLLLSAGALLLAIGVGVGRGRRRLLGEIES